MLRAHPRRYPRLDVRVLAYYTAEKDWSRCVATSLGGGGLFLDDVVYLEPGKEISVRFRPAKHVPLIEAQACVRTAKAGLGAGVEFTSIDAEDRLRLLRMIHNNTSNDKARQRASLATQFQHQDCYTLAFSRDLSLCGMFVETSQPLPVGCSLKVRFNLDQMDQVVTTTAHVDYHLKKLGMGILFDEMPPEHRQAIQEYVENHQDLFSLKSAMGSRVA